MTLHFDTAVTPPLARKSGKYTCVDVLGKGTYGTCYKVLEKLKDSKKDEPCVMKVISLAELKTYDVHAAFSEAQLLSTIKHPHVVGYLDAWVENSHLYIVMEYCDRGDLAGRLQKNALSTIDVLQYARDIACGMQHLHAHKIMHRDLKPSNLFLHRNRLLIGDLGLGKHMEQLSFANTQVGTPLYFSPELCRREPYAFPSDVWAFGCVLYEMLTGGPPYIAMNQTALTDKICSGPAPDLPSTCPTQVRRFIHRTLQKLPEARPTMQQCFETISSLCKAMGGALGPVEVVCDQRSLRGHSADITVPDNSTPSDVIPESDAAHAIPSGCYITTTKPSKPSTHQPPITSPLQHPHEDAENAAIAHTAHVNATEQPGGPRHPTSHTASTSEHISLTRPSTASSVSHLPVAASPRGPVAPSLLNPGSDETPHRVPAGPHGGNDKTHVSECVHVGCEVSHPMQSVPHVGVHAGLQPMQHVGRPVKPTAPESAAENVTHAPQQAVPQLMGGVPKFVRDAACFHTNRTSATSFPAAQVCGAGRDQLHAGYADSAAQSPPTVAIPTSHSQHSYPSVAFLAAGQLLAQGLPPSPIPNTFSGTPASHAASEYIPTAIRSPFDHTIAAPISATVPERNILQYSPMLLALPSVFISGAIPEVSVQASTGSVVPVAGAAAVQPDDSHSAVAFGDACGTCTSAAGTCVALQPSEGLNTVCVSTSACNDHIGGVIAACGSGVVHIHCAEDLEPGPVFAETQEAETAAAETQCTSTMQVQYSIPGSIPAAAALGAATCSLDSAVNDTSVAGGTDVSTQRITCKSPCAMSEAPEKKISDPYSRTEDCCGSPSAPPLLVEGCIGCAEACKCVQTLQSKLAGMQKVLASTKQRAAADRNALMQLRQEHVRIQTASDTDITDNPACLSGMHRSYGDNPGGGITDRTFGHDDVMHAHDACLQTPAQTPKRLHKRAFVGTPVDLKHLLERSLEGSRIPECFQDEDWNPNPRQCAGELSMHGYVPAQPQPNAYQHGEDMAGDSSMQASVSGTFCMHMKARGDVETMMDGALCISLSPQNSPTCQMHGQHAFLDESPNLSPAACVLQQNPGSIHEPHSLHGNSVLQLHQSCGKWFGSRSSGSCSKSTNLGASQLSGVPFTPRQMHTEDAHAVKVALTNDHSPNCDEEVHSLLADIPSHSQGTDHAAQRAEHGSDMEHMHVDDKKNNNNRSGMHGRQAAGTGHRQAPSSLQSLQAVTRPHPLPPTNTEASPGGGRGPCYKAPFQAGVYAPIASAGAEAGIQCIRDGEAQNQHGTDSASLSHGEIMETIADMRKTLKEDLCLAPSPSLSRTPKARSDHLQADAREGAFSPCESVHRGNTDRRREQNSNGSDDGAQCAHGSALMCPPSEELQRCTTLLNTSCSSLKNDTDFAGSCNQTSSSQPCQSMEIVAEQTDSLGSCRVGGSTSVGSKSFVTESAPTGVRLGGSSHVSHASEPLKSQLELQTARMLGRCQGAACYTPSPHQKRTQQQQQAQAQGVAPQLNTESQLPDQHAHVALSTGADSGALPEASSSYQTPVATPVKPARSRATPAACPPPTRPHRMPQVPCNSYSNRQRLTDALQPAGFQEAAPGFMTPQPPSRMFSDNSLMLNHARSCSRITTGTLKEKNTSTFSRNLSATPPRPVQIASRIEASMKIVKSPQHLLNRNNIY